MRVQRSVRATVAAASMALLALSSFALSGCSNAEPSVAAYVDGAKISDRQVTDAAAGATTALGQPVSAPAVVSAMIHGVIAERLATQNNIAITDTERDALLKTTNVAALAGVPAARPLAYDLADQQIVATKLGSDAYLAAVGQQDVTLNPRYGVLDLTQKVVLADRSGSLAKPGSGATPEIPQ